MYADDTALFATSPEKLQNCLNIFGVYCKNNGLKVNASKSKVVVFGGRSKTCKFEFKLGSQALEKVENYTYLGVNLQWNKKFKFQTDAVYSKGIRIFYSLKNIIDKAPNISPAISFMLYDSLLVNCILYGCEVWGFSDTGVAKLEVLNRKFIKYVLGCPIRTPSYFVYGESGRYPLSVIVKCRIIKFWLRIVSKRNSCVQHLTFSMYNFIKINFPQSSWCCNVKSILHEIGCPELWNAEDIVIENFALTYEKLKLKIYDCFLQSWWSEVESSHLYKFYKPTFGMSFYVSSLPKYKRQLISCFLSECPHRNKWHVEDIVNFLFFDAQYKTLRFRIFGKTCVLKFQRCNPILIIIHYLNCHNSDFYNKLYNFVNNATRIRMENSI